MSFLAWAFAFGATAVALPVLFHLIRPAPRGRTPFGSLMFLRQSPPRITRRSRIDNWLLLLIRGLVIVLVTVAFMRPFFRSTSGIFRNAIPERQVAILVDTSASMQRDKVWQEAMRRARRAVDRAKPGDRIALYAFSEQLEALVPFDSGGVDSPAERTARLHDALDGLQPGFLDTRLGDSLMSLARIMAELPVEGAAGSARTILLVSDLQNGANLTGLQGEDWPAEVQVELAEVAVATCDNAAIRITGQRGLTVPPGSSGPPVTVVNDAHSESELFRVAWVDDGNQPLPGTEVEFYVPPGTSRTLPVPLPADSHPQRLLLRGDRTAFDNLRHVTGIRQQQLRIDWLGEERPADPRSPLFFLRKVFPDSAGRVVTIRTGVSPRDYRLGSEGMPHLVVLNRPLDPDEQVALARWVEQGGSLLAVISDPAILDSLDGLAGAVEPAAADAAEDYLMLSGIDFSHPVFAPLAGPLYNDFSRIRFWKTVPLQPAADQGPRPVASFDNGNLAIWEHRPGQGTVIAMASGWDPDSSQLALSSRFLPMMWGVLQMSRGAETPAEQYATGDRLEPPPGTRWQVTLPDGNRRTVQSGEGEGSGILTLDLPGCYRLDDGERVWQVAANMAFDESLTTPMTREQLESLGVLTGSAAREEKQQRDLEKMSEIQMEARQRVWKWLILAVLMLLIVESVLAARRSQAGRQVEGTAS